MRRQKTDPNIEAHLEWIGFVKPTGLVVSAAALVESGAILDRRDIDGQYSLREAIEDTAQPNPQNPKPKTSSDPKTPSDPFTLYPLPSPRFELPSTLDFPILANKVLGWGFSPKYYAGMEDCPVPDELQLTERESGEVLSPTYAVREPEPKEGGAQWQLLIQVIPANESFEKVPSEKGRLELSHNSRLERLLRATNVTAGVLYNGETIRLMSAPRGESSGWLDFRISEMVTTGGRAICSAMRLLLSQTRLLALPKPKRLAALLEDSRKFQNRVSERLAEQVLHALYDLLRGFQAAHDASGGTLLAQVLEEDPDRVYRALLTVILRVVFLLYAEERDMLPEDETFLRYYSLAGLHERLREDAALYPDTMDQRFGAWAQLVVLFRMVYDGAEWEGVKLPQRHGDLFAPNRFPFLEGRDLRTPVSQMPTQSLPLAPFPNPNSPNWLAQSVNYLLSKKAASSQEKNEQATIFEVPLVSDGTIFRALENLLVLDGERLSYRALDVEQIGSVYETMMGFRVERAEGRSLAIRAEKKHGAPTTINLEALLQEPGAKREKWLQENAGRKLSDSVKKGVKEATTLEGLHAALNKAADQRATPDLAPAGSLVLQPSEERRKSGSHYTPRSLTEPIVRTTLEPILKRLSSQHLSFPETITIATHGTGFENFDSHKHVPPPSVGEVGEQNIGRA